MMFYIRRFGFATLFTAAILLAYSISALSAAQTPRAQQARQLNLTDTAHLRYLQSEGSTGFEEGSATGALPGHVRARLIINASFAASFTLYARDGTLKGHGSAKP